MNKLMWLKVGAVGATLSAIPIAYSHMDGEKVVDHAYSPKAEANHSIEMTPDEQEKIDMIARSIMRHTTEYLDMKVPEEFVDSRNLFMGTVPQEWFLQDERKSTAVSWYIVLSHANTTGTKLKLKTETGWKQEKGRPAEKAEGTLVLENDQLIINKLSAEAISQFLEHPETHLKRVRSSHFDYLTSAKVNDSQLFGRDVITYEHKKIERHIADQVRTAEAQLSDFEHDYLLPPNYS